jgi:CheY-like chemotaxis protein
MEKSRSKILVIDDMPSHLLLLQTILEEDGYEVVTLDNGNEALKLIENDGSFTLILLDMMMPDIDGFEFLDLMKEKQNQIPIVVVSAKVGTPSIKKALQKGATDYITKPLNIHDIKNKVSAAIKNT